MSAERVAPELKAVLHRLSTDRMHKLLKHARRP